MYKEAAYCSSTLAAVGILSCQLVEEKAEPAVVFQLLCNGLLVMTYLKEIDSNAELSSYKCITQAGFPRNSKCLKCFRY